MTGSPPRLRRLKAIIEDTQMTKEEKQDELKKIDLKRSNVTSKDAMLE